jgi:hypothetical protein
VLIIAAEGFASGRAMSRQCHMVERQSGPAASNLSLPSGGRVMAEANRKSKSP